MNNDKTEQKYSLNLKNNKDEKQKDNKDDLRNENKEIVSEGKLEDNENKYNLKLKLKENDSINNDNNKYSQRDEAINKFIFQMENKNKEKMENQDLNNKEEEESNDPFLKAEKEYRKKTYQTEDIKSENNLKNKSKEYSENLRCNTEKDDYSNGITNYKLKEKKYMQKLIFDHFKNDIKIKIENEKNTFKPTIFKNPQNLYFKAIEETKLNYFKMKSYDRRTGIFDLKKYNKYKDYLLNKNIRNNNYFNSTKTSFNSAFNKKKYNSIKNEVKVLSYRDYFKSVNKNNKNKNNLIINSDNDVISLNNKHLRNLNNENNNFFYTSISTNIPTTKENKKLNKNMCKTKTINSNFSEERKVSKFGKRYKINKNLIVNSAKNKIPTQTMRAYLLDNQKNQLKGKYSATSKSSRRIKNKSYFMNNLFNSINDPKNPYSINFSRTLLKNKYHLDIYYDFNKIEMGVPLLSIKEAKKRKYKTTSAFSENIEQKKRMAKTTYDNFYSGFKRFTPHKNQRMNNNRYKSTKLN